MNIITDKHNFRIYDVKEYILTSFSEIFGQTYDNRYLSRLTFKEQSISSHRKLYRLFSAVAILTSSVYPSL